MKHRLVSRIKKHLVKAAYCVLSLSVASMIGYTFADTSFQVEAASQGLAQFDEWHVDDRNSWEISNSSVGGIATFKSKNGKESYKIFTDIAGYTYNVGDYLSIKCDGIDLADEEIMLHGDRGNIYLDKAVAYHNGYITMELPDDVERVFKSVNPKLIRIRGTFRNIKAGDSFTIGGIEIHHAGTRPSWDNGSMSEYDPYVQPKGIAVTYYNDIYSRGFAWSTNEKITSGSLYIIKKSGSMNESNIEWSNAEKYNASMTERADVNGKKWHIFKAHVTNLTPGATYYYRVGSGTGGYSKVGTFKVEKSKSGIDEVTFLHLTDCQESAKIDYDVWGNVLRAGAKKFPKSSFVAFSGDLTNYSYTSLKMLEWIWGLDTAKDTLMNMPIAPSSGNHDGFDYSFVDRFDIDYADYVSESDIDLLSGGSYYYTYGKDVIFINMNTNINTYAPEFKSQISWLRGVLEKYKDYKWKVVQVHKGPFSTGDHSNNYDVVDYREALSPIFSKYGVDLVLQGHDHVYTRTASYPFWTENNSDESKYSYEAYEGAGKVTKDYSFDGETRLWNLEPVGTHYVTINYCANKAYDTISDSERDERIHLGINPIKGNGCDSQPKLPMYGVVRIKGNVLCYDAYTYDEETNESKLYDTFSVDKGNGQDITEDNTEDNTEEDIENNTENNTENSTENNTENSTVTGTGDKSGTVSTTADKKNNTSAVTGKVSSEDSTPSVDSSDKNIEFSKNLIVSDKQSNGIYKITKLVKKNGKVSGGNVTYMKPLKRGVTKVTIKDSVKLGDVTFKVTAIGANALKNQKSLTKVTIGKNVKTIGKNAFNGDKKLKSVIIKTTSLTKSKVGAGAFKGINAKAKIKVPAKKLKAYQKILKARGVNGKKQKITK